MSYFSFLKIKKSTSQPLKVGDKFIGKLQNKHRGKILTINERMVEEDEDTLMFIHYYGFEPLK